MWKGIVGMRPLMTAALVIMTFSPRAAADVNLGQILPKTPPGGEVALLGSNLDAKQVSAYNVVFRGNAEYTVPIERVEPTRLVLRVPGTFTAGPYLVFVKVEAGTPQFVGQIDIVAAAPQIHQLTVIADMTKLWVHEQFDFKIIGERLCVDTARGHPSCPPDVVPAARATMPDTKTEAISLFLGPRRYVLGRCTPASLVDSESSGNAPSPSAARPSDAPRPAAVPASSAQGGATSVASQRQLTSDDYQGEELKSPCYWSETPEALVIHSIDVSERGGANEMAIEIAGLRSNTTTLRVGRVTPRMIKWLSLGLVAAILILLGAIGTRVAITSGTSDRSSLLAWTLIDTETNSYSLSKFQLLLWTVSIVFGYVYLLLAHVLTQGNLTFPPFPTNLSFLLGGAGLTTLASSMLTQQRGPKGAGGTAPSFSDLLSSGGVLAADRAQFLIWTLVGVGGFLFILLRELPERIAKLPDIDPNLFGAMGLSALVYVSGKYVRLPGPVISKVTATKGATFDLKIEGQNLHKGAIISVDGQVVDVTPTPPTGATPNPVNANLMPELKVELKVDGPWATGDHLLRVANLDGQYAEIWFSANPPSLSGADPASVESGKTKPVKLTGKDLRTGSMAEWLAPNTTEPSVLEAGTKVIVKSATEAEVTLDSGPTKGQGTLTLVSPRGMRASVQIPVT
jgi:hypothetical protein